MTTLFFKNFYVLVCFFDSSFRLNSLWNNVKKCANTAGGGGDTEDLSKCLAIVGLLYGCLTIAITIVMHIIVIKHRTPHFLLDTDFLCILHHLPQKYLRLLKENAFFKRAKPSAFYFSWYYRLFLVNTYRKQFQVFKLAKRQNNAPSCDLFRNVTQLYYHWYVVYF